jgi:hypothetical protein
MDPLAEIRKRLRKYPQVQYREHSGGITVLPSDGNGFEVSLTRLSNEYMVSFPGGMSVSLQPRKHSTVLRGAYLANAD